MTVDSTDRYTSNISELRKCQPDVADLVDAATISENITKTTGRDGSDTFIIPDESGKNHWLGYSSAPTVSAEELFNGFRYEGGNVVLPGVQTGMEPFVLLRKLPKYAALFVMEDNPVHIKLVFQLYDYATWIASGQLAIFVKDHFESNLRTFFLTHPGYEYPRHMVMVPQCSPIGFSQLQRRLETGGQQALSIHGERMNEWLFAIRHRRANTSLDHPRVAILSSDIQPQTDRFTKRLSRSLDRIRWEYQTSIPNQPGRCHLTSRLHAIERASADLVLTMQSGAESLRSLLPDDLPVANWFLPDMAVSTSLAQDLASQGVVLIAASHQYDIFSDAGIASSQLIRCEVAADDTLFFPLESPVPSESAVTFDAVMIMNLPNDDAHTCGIHLNSHVKLWAAMRDITLGEVDRYRVDEAEHIFLRAQQKSGTNIDDPKVRDHFLTLLRQQLAPTAMARITADTLVRSGYKVGVWGHHWSKDQTSAWIAGGDIPVEQELNQLFQSTKVLVLPDHSETSLQLALDAMCAGVHVMHRATERSWTDHYPELSSVLVFTHSYKTMNDLTKKIRLLVSTNKYQDQLVQAREAILKEHTLSHRLQMIVDRIRCEKSSKKIASSPAIQVESV